MPRSAGVDTGASLRRPGRLRWPLWRPVAWFRAAVLTLSVFPLVRLLYRLDVEGEACFDGLEPAILAANHASHLDNALILLALPAARRRRLAIAAAADTIFKRRGQGYLAALLGNAFPVARGGGGRWTVEYCRWLMDRGWSVLLYPEGRLTVGGPMGPFRRGIGLIAVETGRPVVPVRLDVLRRGMGEGRRLPWRGHVRVCFGEPLRFAADAEIEAVVARLQAAVASLSALPDGADMDGSDGE